MNDYEIKIQYGQQLGQQAFETKLATSETQDHRDVHPGLCPGFFTVNRPHDLARSRDIYQYQADFN
jgi:hypothetical protein